MISCRIFCKACVHIRSIIPQVMIRERERERKRGMGWMREINNTINDEHC